VGSLPSTLEAQARAINTQAMGTQAPPRPARQAAVGEAGAFAIQIGAYKDSAEAERHMSSVRQRAGGLLDPYHSVAVPVRSGAKQLYRARFKGFDATAAASTCLHLRRLQVDCFVVNAQ
jgi:D-alanyl-D-alanine carboxypeptidase